jgi:predicted acylesterase/phospholipase RssA
MSVLTRSSFVASVYWTRERRTAEQASLYLRIPVADLRLLAFERIDAIAARGYDATRDEIRRWWEARKGALGASAAMDRPSDDSISTPDEAIVASPLSPSDE